MVPVLVKQQTAQVSEDTEAPATEMVAFCPRCKTLETVWFVRDNLMPTLKFFQEASRVYHDCGSREPCRLYRTQ